MHWASEYIGIPYSETGEGPDSYYCWSFFRFVEKKHFGRDLPQIPNEDALLAAARSIRDNPVRDEWELTDNPKDGDAVLLRQARYPIHIGVWLSVDGHPGLLHCVRRSGVVFQKIEDLPGSGWRVEGYYSYLGDRQ